MKREKEFNDVKQLIKQLYPLADSGLFDTRNIAGDPMENVFCGKYFQLDICHYWSYFEVFGMNDKEFNELKKYYKSLGDEC